MPQETEPWRKPVPRPLLPPALRRPAALLLAGGAAVTVSLALAFTHQARPGWLDAGVDARIRGGLGGGPRAREGPGPPGGRGSGPPPAAPPGPAPLAPPPLPARGCGGPVGAGAAAPAAVAWPAFALTPLAGRTIRGSPCFPSGHAPAMFALAAACAILLASPPRPRLPGTMRLLLALGAGL